MPDLSFALTGTLILLVIAFMLFYLNRKQRRSKASRDLYLQELVQRYNFHKDERELQYHFLLALDRENKKLLYVQNLHLAPQEQLIDLDQVQRSKVVETVQTFYMDDEKKRKDLLITQIGLEVHPLKGEQPPVIVFYDYIVNSVNQLQELRTKAAQWEKSLNAVIAKQKAEEDPGR